MTKLLIACFAFIFVILIIITPETDAFPSNKKDVDFKFINAGGLTVANCRKDEDFLQCGTCPKSCKNPDPDCNKPKCTAPQCLCKKGTVRATDGQCIKPEECPPRILN